MVKLMPVFAIPEETEAVIGRDAAKVYGTILSVLADRKSTSSVIAVEKLTRMARCGVPEIEAAQSVLHSNGLLDIDLESWDLVNPQLSRFRYTVPECSTSNN